MIPTAKSRNEKTPESAESRCAMKKLLKALCKLAGVPYNEDEDEGEPDVTERSACIVEDGLKQIKNDLADSETRQKELQGQREAENCRNEKLEDDVKKQKEKLKKLRGVLAKLNGASQPGGSEVESDLSVMDPSVDLLRDNIEDLHKEKAQTEAP